MKIILNYLAFLPTILLLYEDNFEHLAFLPTILLLYEDNFEHLAFLPAILQLYQAIEVNFELVQDFEVLVCTSC